MRWKNLFVAALCLLCASSARAEKWALLIGINHYEDANYIASLGAADTDARELKKTLKSQLGFPEANITLLVSDGDTKPTRSNIVEALGGLSENVKPGDTVFVFYSGHGIELEGKSCLLPYDFRGRNAFTGIETALEVNRFKELLGKVKAKALIMVWDMCRNDPFSKGKDGSAKRNPLANPKGWGIVPAGTTARSADAPVIANFFACSSGETSFEWTDKNRGYFAYYLEKGIRGEAADAQGNVTLSSLAKYVQKNVPTVTKANEGQAQTPYPEFGGASAGDFVLATGKTPSSDEPTVKTTPGTVKNVSTKTTLTFSGQPSGAKILVEKAIVKGDALTMNLIEPTKEVEVAITADGYEPRVLRVPLQRGQSVSIDAALVKLDAEKPVEPGTEPNSNVPPPTSNPTGPLGEILTRIRTTHNTATALTMRPLKFYGAAAATIGNVTVNYENYFGVVSPGSGAFRVEYVEKSDTGGRKLVSGFDGKSAWQTANGRPEPSKPDDRFFNNPAGPLFYALTAPTVTLSERFSKPKDARPYLSASDPILGDFKILYDPKTFQVTEISLKRNGFRPVFRYSNFKPVDGVLIPHTIVGDAGIGNVTYNYSRVEPNAPFGGSYFSGR